MLKRPVIPLAQVRTKSQAIAFIPQKSRKNSSCLAGVKSPQRSQFSLSPEQKMIRYLQKSRLDRLKPLVGAALTQFLEMSILEEIEGIL
jgi:hypothetical protein